MYLHNDNYRQPCCIFFCKVLMLMSLLPCLRFSFSTWFSAICGMLCLILTYFLQIFSSSDCVVRFVRAMFFVWRIRDSCWKSHKCTVKRFVCLFAVASARLAQQARLPTMFNPVAYIQFFTVCIPVIVLKFIDSWNVIWKR